MHLQEIMQQLCIPDPAQLPQNLPGPGSYPPQGPSGQAFPAQAYPSIPGPGSFQPQGPSGQAFPGQPQPTVITPEVQSLLQGSMQLIGVLPPQNGPSPGTYPPQAFSGPASPDQAYPNTPSPGSYAPQAFSGPASPDQAYQLLQNVPSPQFQGQSGTLVPGPPPQTDPDAVAGRLQFGGYSAVEYVEQVLGSWGEV